MQSLYRVIKSTVIEGSNVIAPPVINIAPTPDIADINEDKPEHIPDEFEIMLSETQAKIEKMLASAKEESRLLIEKAKQVNQH
jgi:hypothetical protein